MKKVSRIISALLVCVLLTGVCVYVESSGGYSEEYRVLYDIGIISAEQEYSYSTDADVTRGEFASMLVKLMGLESLKNTSGFKVFNDISGHKYESDISALAELKIINGFDDGSFKPNENILYEHAIKSFVSVAGYDLYALNAGGYPTGYLNVAHNIGITRGITIKFGEVLKSQAMVQILYNTVNAKMFVQTSFGSVIGSYETSKDRTVLSELRNIRKVKGIVTCTSKTSLTGNSKVARDEIEIDGKAYKKGESDADEYLGLYVTAYYIDNDDNNEILSVQPDSRNDIVVIRAAKIAKDHSDFSYQNFIAYDNEKVIRYSIDGNADFIYNGKAYTDFDLNTMKPDTGNVTLVDNNGDGIYEIIFVTEYENFVVDSLSSIEKTIYDKYGKKLQLETNGGRSSIDIKTQYDDEVAFEELREWDVLCVAKSMDGQVVKILVVNDPVTGVVEQIEMENDLVTIDGESFEIATSFKEAVKDKKLDVNNIQLGNKGYFYLDIDEKIAAVRLSASTSWNYGFMINAVINKGLDAALSLKLYRSDDNVEVFDCIKNIRIDGNQKSSTEALSLLSKNGKVIPQLIKFRLNSDYLISDIAIGSMDIQAKTGDNLYLAVNKVSRKFTAGTNRLINESQNNILMDDSTLVFLAPLKEENLYDENYYSLKNQTYFRDLETYNVSAYEVEFNDLAKAIVIYADDSAPTYPARSTTVVDKITTVVEDDGTIKKKLFGYTRDGREVSYTESKEGTLDGVEQGDIVRYSLNSKDQINDFKVYFKEKNHPKTEGMTIMQESTDMSTVNASVFMQYGVIYEKQGDFIKTTIEIPSSDEIPQVKLTYNLNQPGYITNIYLCDRKSNTIKKIDSTKVEDYIYGRNKNARAVWFSNFTRLLFLVIYQ